MAKTKNKTVYSCQSCGFQTPKWLGKCPECNEWNTLVEEMVSSSFGAHRDLGGVMFAPEAPQPLSAVRLGDEERFRTGISEFDRVLGGGIVPGSVVLIGGDPGIGKSTLLIQSLNQIAESGNKVLYVSGEESVRQTKIRAARLGIESDNLYVQGRDESGDYPRYDYRSQTIYCGDRFHPNYVYRGSAIRPRYGQPGA